MSILFIHQNFPSQFIHLARELESRKHRIAALSFKGHGSLMPSIERIEYAVSRGTSKEIHPWLLDFETKTIRAEAVYRKACELRDGGYIPDLVIAHPGWGESLLIKEVWPNTKLILYAEFYYHAQGADIGFDPEFPTLPDAACAMRYKNINNHLHFDIADAALSPTQWQKSTFPEYFQPKITVIHDGIDTDQVVPNANTVINLTIDQNQKISLSKKDQVITFVNRNLEPYRGYHSFMRSLPKVFEKNPNAYVLIVGGDGVSYGAKPDINRYGNQSWKEIFAKEVKPLIPDNQWRRIIFLGNLPYANYLAILQISSVHVYLTYPFVLSWSLLEAMSSECAIVGSDTAPVGEVIEHNETGKLVNFFSYEAVATAINELLASPKERVRLGKNARAHVIQNYDLKRVCLPKQIAWVENLMK